METRIKVLLTDQPGVLSRLTFALQPLGLGACRYEAKDEQSRPGFALVTLVADGSGARDADLISALQSVDGLKEVLDIAHGDIDPQGPSLAVLADYLDHQGSDDTSTRGLDSYFRAHIRGLMDLVSKLQGHDACQALLTHITDAAVNAKWPASLNGSGTDSSAEISAQQYRAVFHRTVGQAGHMVGAPLVSKQLQAVDKRMRDAGEDVDSLAKQLGVANIP